MGGIEEEVGVSIEGKPLEREPGETRKGLAERWVEDYLPHAAMSRFLVDGERLSHLDPKRINIDIIGGIDDATGIGLLHRLKKHLNSVRRNTLRSLAPDDQAEGINQLLEIRERIMEDRDTANSQLQELSVKMEEDSQRIMEIQDEIESLTRDGGSENVQLRMDYAIKQSELTSSRRELHEHLMGALPFVVAGMPSDLSEWDIDAILDSKRAARRIEENMEFLESVIDATGVGSATRRKLLDSGRNITESSSKSQNAGFLSGLPLTPLESLVMKHSELGMSEAPDNISESIDEAIHRLEAFEISEQALARATAGSGIAEKATELKELAKSLGIDQAEIARLRGEVSQKDQSRIDIERRIEEIRQREDSDSLLNRRLSRIDDLEKLTNLITSSVRKSFAGPLEEAFKEGFELLSRKSGRIEKVTINTEDYSTHLSMRGISGNWLDRDLSATERQHVGLALVYSLRRASTEWSMPLPVVIDTPTSRMDSEHKSWSVTRFYPQLSNQVVVFATSDDLSGGLFEELAKGTELGPQLLVQEVSENSVEVVTSNLESFFGGL